MRRGLLLVVGLAAAAAAAQNTANPQYQLTGKDYRTEAVEIQQMFYNVAGAVKATNASITSLPASGVTQVVAGSGITVSPAGGTGAVTVNATGGGTTGISSSCAAGFYLSTSTYVNGVVKGGGCMSVTSGTGGVSTGVVTTAALTGNGNAGASALGVNSSSVAVYATSGNLVVPYGVVAATGVFSSTLTVQGAAFSVGGATFTVSGGSGTLAYLMTAGSFSGVGTSLTALTAANVSGGVLGAAVIASSVAATAVTAGSYGSATQVPNYTVGVDGRLTAAANTSITGLAESAITNLTTDLAAKASTGTNASLSKFLGAGNGVVFATSVVHTASVTFQDNAFSVGGSSFIVGGGSVTVGYSLTATAAVLNGGGGYDLTISSGIHFLTAATGIVWQDGSVSTTVATSLVGPVGPQGPGGAGVIGFVTDNFLAQTTGSQKNFTLSNTPSGNSENVILDGHLLSPTSDYTLTGAALAVTTAPAVACTGSAPANCTSSFYVRYATGATGVNAFILTGTQTVSGRTIFASSFTVTSGGREIILSTSSSYAVGDAAAFKIGTGGDTVLGAAGGITSIFDSLVIGATAPLRGIPIATGTIGENKIVYGTGTYTFTPPRDVYRVFVKAWGGGGAGGSGSAPGNLGGNGSGGAFAAGYANVTPGVPYTVFVGSGGIGGSRSLPANTGFGGIGLSSTSGGKGGNGGRGTNGVGGGGGAASGLFLVTTSTTGLVVAAGGGAGGGADGGGAGNGASATGAQCTGGNCNSNANGTDGATVGFGGAGGGGGGYSTGGIGGQSDVAAGFVGDSKGDTTVYGSNQTPGNNTDGDYVNFVSTGGIGAPSLGDGSPGGPGAVVIYYNNPPVLSVSTAGINSDAALVINSSGIVKMALLVVTTSVTLPATVTSVVPRPQTITTGAIASAAPGTLTTGIVGLENIPQAISVATITYNIGTLSTAGTYKICIYNEANTNKLIDVTSNTNKLGVNNVTVSPPVLLQAGNYYILIGWATTATSTLLDKWTSSSEAGFSIAPLPKALEGTISGRTSGTCDSTILGTITGTISDSPLIRLDN